MLDSQSRSLTAVRTGSARGLIEAIDFPRLFTAARRQLPLVMAGALIGVVIGFVYVSTATPRYSAMANLLIDTRPLRAVQDVSAVAESIPDTTLIDSQVEILRSEKLALEVINTLNLKDDPEFTDPPDTITGMIIGNVVDFFDWTFNSFFGSPEEAPRTQSDSDFRKERTALGVLLGNSFVARVPKTYVLSVGYTSPNPRRAAEVANALANAYLTDQLNSRYEATRRASSWLQARIEELRTQATAADSAVQKFRAENNLVSADGKLVSEQQLSELSSQLVQARSEMAESEAKYKQIREIIDTRQTDAAVTESLNSSVINELRGKYLDASKREAEISAKLGPQHLQAVSFRAQMAEYERLIFTELGRIAATYQSSYNISKSRVESLTASLAQMSGATAGTNQSLVKLRQLQQDADTYQALYQTFLQRYQEAVQQQSFPMNDARVITAASRPLSPSEPKKVMALLLSLILGSMAGAGVGALREARERGFRTGDQVRETVPNAPFLGMLPALDGPAPRRTATKRRRRNAATADLPEEKLIKSVPARYRYVVDHPLSAFSETLRSTKVAADRDIRDRVPKVIGFVSVVPGEGKSTVSKNFATLLASQGSRVLLVDADIRSAGLTRAIAAEAEVGILEVIMDQRPIASVMMREPESGLYFVPAVYGRRVAYAGDLLWSYDFRDITDELGRPFDYIVVDLPPAGAVVDARAAASNLDGFVLVVEWGKTARRAIETTIATNDVIADKLIGVILNKVDMKQVGKYENYGSTEFYSKEYATYYRTKI